MGTTATQVKNLDTPVTEICSCRLCFYLSGRLYLVRYSISGYRNSNALRNTKVRRFYSKRKFDDCLTHVLNKSMDTSKFCSRQMHRVQYSNHDTWNAEERSVPGNLCMTAPLGLFADMNTVIAVVSSWTRFSLSKIFVSVHLIYCRFWLPLLSLLAFRHVTKTNL
jgi:hypothetical protein